MAAEYSQAHQSGILALIQHYWHILIKWKWTIALIIFMATGAAAGYSLLLKPVYSANGTIWIEADPNILPFQEVQTLGVADTNLSSHVVLLQSRALASEVIDKLKLYDNPDFAGKLKKGEARPDPNLPAYREMLIQEFINNLSVSPIERTRLIYIRYNSRTPKLAADTLNALFDAFIEMIVNKRYSASEQASNFLNTQIAELRNQIEEKEKELNKYGSEKDILPLTAAEAPTVTRLSDVNSALTAATLDKINKLNYYNQLKAAPLGEIPNAPEGSLFQRLREQYVTLSRDYATRLAVVKPEYPEMQRLKSELDSATEALQNETQNLIRNAYTDYLGALRQEQSLQKLLSEQKDLAYKANSNSVLYNSLKIELDNKKALLETLSRRQSETDVSAKLKGLENLDVWVVDKADYPLHPNSPNKRKSILMGFFLGLIAGIGTALGLEYLNNTVKTTKDISDAIGIPTLGSVPAFENDSSPKGPRGEIGKILTMIRSQNRRQDLQDQHRKKQNAESPLDPKWLPQEKRNDSVAGGTKIELIALREPQSIQAESYRSIRTTLLVSSPPGKIKSILFTSPLAREGKSSTVSNLGITLAEANKRILIVDSDLRKPKQAKIFGMNNNASPGLSTYLSSHLDEKDIIRSTEVPNLAVITSGPLPPNPIELLTSDRMDSLVAYLKKTYDFILFDTAPILAVSDALAMGPMADTIVLIVRGGQTPLPALRQARQKLDSHKLKCLGAILNGVDLVEQDGYYARQYYHYSKPE